MHPNTKQTVISTILATLFCLSIVLTMSVASGAFAGERINYGDEAPHYLNSVVVSEYIKNGFGQSPISFAAEYYQRYPKIAFLVWPPLFHVSLGIFMAVFGYGQAKALVFVAIGIATTGAVLFSWLRSEGCPLIWASVPSLLFIVSPIAEQQLPLIMTDGTLTLLTVISTWALARFLRQPTVGNSIVLGIVTASCCLCKGNGLAAALAIPLAMTLAGRWNMWRRKEIWISLGIVAVLSFGPIAISSRWLSDNPSFSRPSVAELLRQVWFYMSAFKTLTGSAVAVASFVGLMLFVVRPKSDTYPRCEGGISMAASAIAVVIFHSVVAHSSPDTRYLFPAVPCMLYFLPTLTVPNEPGRRGLVGGTALVVVMILFFAFEFSLPRVIPGGFRRAAEVLMYDRSSQPLRALIFGTDLAEGAFITSVADLDVRRTATVVRSTKLLMVSDWHATSTTYLFNQPAQVAAKIERLGIQWIVLQKERHQNDKLRELVEGAVSLDSNRFRLFADWQANNAQLEHIQVYRVLHPAIPPAERLEFALSFSRSIVGTRRFSQ